MIHSTSPSSQKIIRHRQMYTSVAAYAAYSAAGTTVANNRNKVFCFIELFFDMNY